MWGCRDTGVYIQEQEGGNWQKLEPKKLEKMIVAVTKSHKSERTELAKQIVPADEFREIGGSGSKTWAVIVSEVSVQLYPSNGTKKWDTCAPEALVRALGGNLTDIYGQKYLYNKNIDLPNVTGVLASLFDHESLVEKLKSIPKSQDR